MSCTMKTITSLFRRYFNARPQGHLLRLWAEQHGRDFKHVRDGSGFVVEAPCERLEWGPPQRHYLQQQELRMRIETRLPRGAEMMILTRRLAEQLEREAYERLVQGQQTELRFDMPEEMRWLAALRQASLEHWPQLDRHFVAVAAVPQQVQRWVEGEVAQQLIRAVNGWLGPDAPLVLMLLRGRLYVRTEADVLDTALLDGMSALAWTALERVQQLDLSGVLQAVVAGLDATEPASGTRIGLPQR